MFSTLVEKYKMISLTKFQGMKKEFSLHRNWSKAFKLKLYTGLTLLLTLPNILEVVYFNRKVYQYFSPKVYHFK